MIKRIALDHKGGRYHFRLHDLKTRTLCKEFPQLNGYISKVFDNCPNDYFNSGPRSSKIKFNLNLDLIKVRGHEVSALAKHALTVNKERYRTDHSRVQVFMLENDKYTIAVEVPIWLEPNETRELLKKEGALSGHIDILRVDNGKIWIWDYKPCAHKERYACTQVYFYALMLSKRTGVSLDNFRCGYFDENYAFMFKPVFNNLIKFF